MKNIWKEIKKEMEQISPKIYNSLNKPASKTEIDFLEKELNLILPESFKDYLSVCNGQNHNQVTCFIGYNPFLTITEIISDWKMMNGLFLEDKPIDFITENKVKPLIWSDKWIPFSNFESSNRLIIDLNSGKNGIDGQIIGLYTGCDLEANDIVISESFEEFGLKVLKTLKNREFEMEDGVLECEWII